MTRIQRACLADGPGLRSTVFLQGCPLRCWWCHNPESRTPVGGSLRRVDELTDELLRDRRFWSRSGGVTLSGGEPLAQSDAAAALLQRLGAHGVHRAVETAAAVSRAALWTVLPHVDLWLFDLKSADPATLRRHTGARLATVLGNLRAILSHGAALRLRVPLIRGVNDHDAAWREIAELVANVPGAPPVELLPGHDLARGKGAAVPSCVPAGRAVAGCAARLRERGVAVWSEPCSN